MARPIVFQSFVWIVLLTGILYQNDAICQLDTAQVIGFDTSKVIELDTSKVISFDTIKKNKGGLETKVDYQADDSIRFDLPNKLVYLYGNARLQYEDMDLAADFMILDFGKKTLQASGTLDSAGKVVGKPYFKNKDQEVETDSVLYFFEQKRGRLRGVTMQEGEGFIHMDKVYRKESGEIFSNEGLYTTCSHENPHFYLKTRKLKLVPNDKIVFGPSNLYIEDVPTPLVLPFGIFPTKDGRKSGLVFPEIGTEVVRGYNVRNLGYYFGINDNMDLLLSGDFYFRGSWALRARTRYIKKYHHNGSFEANYSRNIIGEKEDQSYQISPDFKIFWRHSQDSKKRPGTSFNANVDVQSSSYNRFSSTETQTIVNNELSSSINYGKIFNLGEKNFNLNIGAGHRQNTSTKAISVTLPSMNLGLARFNPLYNKKNLGKKKWYEKIGVSYNTSFENRVNTIDTLLFEGKAWDEFKIGMTHNIPVSTTIKAGYFTLSPNFNYTDYWYLETLERTMENIAGRDTLIDVSKSGFSRAGNWNVGMGVNTRIFGTLPFAKSKKLVALRHVMTPNVGFTYRPEFNKVITTYDSLISGTPVEYSRFEGGIKGDPSGSESGSLNFGLNNNFELKTRSKDSGKTYNYIKLIENLSASGRYNFLADSLKLSNIGVNARTTLFKKLGISGRMNYAPYARDTNKRTINKFEWNENGRIARLTSAQLLFNVSLSPDDFRKDKEESKYYKPLPYYYYYNINFVDFNVPWTLNFDYNMDFRPESDVQVEQTLGFRGDIKLTENWKIGYSSGYSIDKKQIALTKFDIHRSLHCWQFSFSWIPTGLYQSFTFSIFPKSQQLQELKLNKRKSFVDLNAGI